MGEVTVRKMYKIGNTILLKENMKYGERVNDYCSVNAVAAFFSGYPVKIIKCYNEHDNKGYGVRFKDSREFFVSDEMIEKEITL